MSTYNIPNPDKYINPNTVNFTKFIKIFADDPRNNPAFLSANPNVVVIDVPYDPDNENNVFYDDYDIDFDNTNSDNSNSTTIESPKNLSIGNFETKISNDGNVYYTATLTFDDIDYAVDYEYVLEISQ